MWEIISSVISGVLAPFFTWLNKKEDTTVAKYTVDGQVNVEAMRQDTQIILARAALAAAMKDDPATKYGRWFFIIPTGIYYALIVYVSAFGKLTPSWVWVILELPKWIQYMPYAVVAYLFVTAWKK